MVNMDFEFGGALGSLGKGLMDFGSQAAMSAINAAQARENMRYSDDLQRAYTRDQYQLQKEGLIKAGFNPLLGLGSSPSQEGINAGFANSGAPSGVDLFQAAQTAKLNKEMINKTKGETENLGVLNDKTRQDIQNSINMTLADVGLRKAQTALVLNDLKKGDIELNLLKKNLHYYDDDRKHSLAQGYMNSGAHVLSSVNRRRW